MELLESIREKREYAFLQAAIMIISFYLFISELKFLASHGLDFREPLDLNQVIINYLRGFTAIVLFPIVFVAEVFGYFFLVDPLRLGSPMWQFKFFYHFLAVLIIFLGILKLLSAVLY